MSSTQRWLAAPQKRSAAKAAPDPAQLKLANINPATGLANDYLDHFDEAVAWCWS